MDKLANLGTEFLDQLGSGLKTHGKVCNARLKDPFEIPVVEADRRGQNAAGARRFSAGASKLDKEPRRFTL